MFDSNYLICLAGVGLVPRLLLLLVFEKRFEEGKDTKEQKKSNPLGSAPCFWSQKCFKGCPNGIQNEAHIRKKAIQKLIDKWIPICIASGLDC